MPAQRLLGAIVLAAGLGTRMRSRRAKVLHELAGRPLVRYPLAALEALDPDRVALVVGHQPDDVRAAVTGSSLRDLRAVIQPEQRGTGHAVACATEAFGGFTGDVLILYGDVPLIRPAALEALLRAHRAEAADLTLVTMSFADPTGYGRILRAPDGRVIGIVEERDASDAERGITEVNPGLYAVRSEVLFPLLAELRPDNAQGELYLTDLVALAARAGYRVSTVAARSPGELAGINTRAELARMEATLKVDIVERWMAAGVTFEDPATAYVGPDVTIGSDTVIGPNVQLRGRTRIGSGCRLDGTAYLVDATVGDRAHLLFACVVEGAEIGADARIGPFARLRPGTRVAERVHIGNFVETKKAVIGAGTKANHLSYLGDCEVGPDGNIGAGTITCNYDGSTGQKSRTVIGARVQIGSDSQLVAPVSVGDDAYVGTGTTVRRDVPAGALVVNPKTERHVPGWTARRRAAVASDPSPPSKKPAAARPRSRKRRASARRAVARPRRRR
ncbi:MAG TPA: bifunctional UDP-N-acetylglucosamine diphosphorylase/glucosamine-1-phosphate N-acetyltransferase GlmU [Candidatus Binatus sp.]|nr:bifunctional UDP-N-acetylglucosamine diphosphorylase/glucosamine-1-phosphate N-acetyltransferase GlmU [Candidatus Binatus sp.]